MLERAVQLLQTVVLAAQQAVASASPDLAAINWEQEDCSSSSSNTAKDAGKGTKGGSKAEASTTGVKGNQGKGKPKSAGKSKVASSNVGSDVCEAPLAPGAVAASAQMMVEGLLLLGEVC
jgi:hypothetical protein